MLRQQHGNRFTQHVKKTLLENKIVKRNTEHTDLFRLGGKIKSD